MNLNLAPCLRKVTILNLFLTLKSFDVYPFGSILIESTQFDMSIS